LFLSAQYVSISAVGPLLAIVLNLRPVHDFPMGNPLLLHHYCLSQIGSGVDCVDANFWLRMLYHEWAQSGLFLPVYAHWSNHFGERGSAGVDGNIFHDGIISGSNSSF